MDIKVLKLTGGDEFVCELVEETETTYEIRNPQMLVQTAPQQMSFMPWFAMAESAQSMDREMSLPKTAVLYTDGAIDNIKQQYDKVFGVGIVTPANDIIQAS